MRRQGPARNRQRKQLLNADAERSEHVSIIDKPLPIDVALRERLTDMANSVFAPPPEQLRSVAQVLFVPAVLRRSSAATLENCCRRRTARLANVDKPETYSPLVTKVEHIRECLTDLEAQPIKPDPSAPVTGIAAEAWSTETGSRLTVPELAARPEGVQMIVVPVVRDLQQPVKVLECPVTPYSELPANATNAHERGTEDVDVEFGRCIRGEHERKIDATAVGKRPATATTPRLTDSSAGARRRRPIVVARHAGVQRSARKASSAALTVSGACC